MTIDLINFTPVQSFTGGVFIGIAALILMLANGRIMGASGIISGLISNDTKNGWIWRLLFILGTMAGPLILLLIINKEMDYVPVSKDLVFYLAALLVGFGSALGSGCTSGHGICGLALFSRRSFASVMIFVSTGILTVLVIKTMGGL